MGSLCSKASTVNDYDVHNEKGKREQRKSSVQMVAPPKEEVRLGVDGLKNEGVRIEGSLRSRPKTTSTQNTAVLPAKIEENAKTRIIERPKSGDRRHSMDSGRAEAMHRISNIPHGAIAELDGVGWPSWLTSVAPEAVKGWNPRRTDSFEKIRKIGQGTYSSVYMARDLITSKIVAMKKVRFVNMDPESVRFMAREICILRRLDHPNVMKLEALVTSRVSGSLYLVFEYMEHDLAGLLASPRVPKFNEQQIKCFMKQILCGLEHCHSRGILHRDIKGANILIDSNGNLKIGDFGLANFYKPDQKHPLTSRVVTLWYRAPELLLGVTDYGPEIDLWSVGCILAELFAGKPIMPGRTEVEQMHKIFKLCGSPTEEFWSKKKFPHASSFKSQRVYKRRVSDVFKDFPPSALALLEVLLSIDPEGRGTASSALRSEFFRTNPLPCDPSSLPKYPPSKEFDARMREEEARRQRDDSVKGSGTEYASNISTKQAIPQGQGQLTKSIGCKSGTGLNHSTSMIHPNAVGYAWSNKVKDDSIGSIPVRTLSTSQHGRGSQVHQLIHDASDYHPKIAGLPSNIGSRGFAPKKNRILFSGPLMPPGGNMEDMLKEHEKQIQEAVRKARMGKSRPD